MNKTLFHSGILLTTAVLAVGCAGNNANKSVATADTQAEPVQHEAQVTQSESHATPVPYIASIEPDSMPEQDINTYPDVDVATTTQPTQNVFQFGFDQAELSDSDIEQVKQHAQYLIDNPDIQLKIVGHTDHHGPKVYNEYLSKQRASAVAKILIEAGVTESQLEISALADEQPLAEATHTRMNRRVELQYNSMNLVSK